MKDLLFIKQVQTAAREIRKSKGVQDETLSKEEI